MGVIPWRFKSSRPHHTRGWLSDLGASPSLVPPPGPPGLAALAARRAAQLATAGSGSRVWVSQIGLCRESATAGADWRVWVSQVVTLGWRRAPTASRIAVGRPVVIPWTTRATLGKTKKVGGQPCGSRADLLTPLRRRSRVAVTATERSGEQPGDDLRLRPTETRRGRTETTGAGGREMHRPLDREARAPRWSGPPGGWGGTPDEPAGAGQRTPVQRPTTGIARQSFGSDGRCG